jgi:hypothetical protein
VFQRGLEGPVRVEPLSRELVRRPQESGESRVSQVVISPPL